MVLELKVKRVSIDSGENIVILNEKDALKLNLKAHSRVYVYSPQHYAHGVFIVYVDKGKGIKEGEIGFVLGIEEFKEGETVRVRAGENPKSKDIIRKKMKGQELSAKEIRQLVEDIYYERLSDIELSSYITSVYINGMSIKEIVSLTKEMVRYGDVMRWKPWEKIADKHSIGGVPGNRTTPLVVSIVAAAGIKIPKTSSRSITSPAGTADTMEVVAEVEFSLEEIKRIVNKTKGCLVWGGALDIAPVDDKIIRVEHPLSIDPEGQVIASILSKKKAMGSKYVMIDIPYGEGSKIIDLEVAKLLAQKFKVVGAKIGMNIDVLITKGDAPIGRGIGPVLEIIDIISALYGKGPKDLTEKSLELAGTLLKMTGKGDYKTAKRILHEGKAFKKFKEIVEAQNGTLNKSFTDMLGHVQYDVKADKSGVVYNINNKVLSEVAKRAGAPAFKGAGIYLFKNKGERVKKGETIMRIYAESEKRMDYAIEYLRENEAFFLTQKHKFIIKKL